MNARRFVVLHPVALVALAVWALNDHVLKAALHNTLTGKLSDIASLIAFPLIATGAVELFTARRRHEVLLFWVVATGCVMVTINLFDIAADGYRIGLAMAQWPWLALMRLASDGTLPGLHRVALTMDPSDALTVPALAIPLVVGWRRTE